MFETKGCCELDGVIVSVNAPEVPPAPAMPFGGLFTVILTVSGATTWSAVSNTESSVGLIYKVASAVPLKFTMELVTKLVPFTNKPVEMPAGILAGFSDEIAGNGLETGNSTDVDAPPPGAGLKTKTTAVPPLSTSPPMMPTFSCDALTNVVLRAWPPKYTVAPGTKFEPFTCSVNGFAVAIVEGGASVEIMGLGLVVVGGAKEIASCVPSLGRVSVHGNEASGLRIPVAGSIENPMICAKPVRPFG